MRLVAICVWTLWTSLAFGKCLPPGTSLCSASSSEVIFLGRAVKATPKSDMQLLKSLLRALGRGAEYKGEDTDAKFTNEELHRALKKLGIPVEQMGEELMPIQRTRFEILESFRGVAGKRIELETVMETHMGYSFEVGKTYLVFAFRDKETGKLTTTGCNRTQEVEGESGDLAAVRTIFRESGRGRLYGSVSSDSQFYNFQFDQTPKPVEGVRVVLTGRRETLKRTSGPDGKFDFAFVPAGKYALTAESAGQTLTTPATIDIEGRSCSWLPIYAPR